MSDHTHLKWLNKFVTTADAYSHTRNKIQNWTQFRNETDSLFGISWNDWVNLLLLWISNYTQKLNTLLQDPRYYRLTNPAFWLIWKFLNYNSRARFFPDTKFFTENLKTIINYRFKKTTHEWMRLLPKPLFRALLTSQHFYSKIMIRLFPYCQFWYYLKN